MSFVKSQQEGAVLTLTLDRPEALNALNGRVSEEVAAAASVFDADDGVGAIVVTGSERAFAAGADEYLQKPFSTRELVVRTQALLARA